MNGSPSTRKSLQVALGFVGALSVYLIVAFLVFSASQDHAVAGFRTALPPPKRIAIGITSEAVFLIVALALWCQRKFASIGALLFVLVDTVVSLFGY
jgi:hypothetical protein